MSSTAQCAWHVSSRRRAAVCQGSGQGKAGGCSIRQRIWSGSAAGSNVRVWATHKRMRHVSTRECSG